MAKKVVKEEEQPKSGLVENTNEAVAAPVQSNNVQVEEVKTEEVNPHTIGLSTRAYRQ
jgi:hypothetical protein